MDLAHRVAGDSVQELVVARLFVAGEMADSVASKRSFFAITYDERHGDLAEIVVRHANHSRLHDARDFIQNSLDFFRVHVESAGDNQVVGSPEQADPAVMIGSGEVTGSEVSSGVNDSAVCSGRCQYPPKRLGP